MALTRQGMLSVTRINLHITPPSPLPPPKKKKRICFLFSEIKACAAEFFTNDFGSIDGEAGILIQAIMSIKSIINQDPPGHEKVYLSFPFLAKLLSLLLLFFFIYAYHVKERMEARKRVNRGTEQHRML